MMKARVFAGLLILGAWAGAGSSATTTYSDEGSFVSQLQPNYYLEDFDSSLWTIFELVPSPQSFSSGGWSYDLGAPHGLAGNPNGSGGAVSTAYSTDPITINFTGTQRPTAVGGFFWPGDIEGSPITGTITLNLQGGGSYTYADQTLADFKGFITDSPIFSMTVVSAGGPEWPTLDHLYVGSSVGGTSGAPIPEPLTLTVAGLSIGALGAYLRRRLRRAA
jgi:hypothetical protein